MTTKTNTLRQGEKGNVLFLILIAVALFAALSYAVTQSTRSGSGDASGETNLINSAQLAQYPAGVRTSVVRMIIAGTSVEQLLFNAPANFADASDQSFLVFHPSGGGAVFQKAPNEVMASGNQADWIFTSDYEIEEIGTTGVASPVGNDVIAILPGVAQNVCRKINDELGIDVSSDTDGDLVPNAGASIAAPVYATNLMDDDHSGLTANEVAVISGPFKGQPFGCFDSDDGDDTSSLVYYHVLVER